MKLKFLFILIFLSSLIYSQSKPLLYFCQSYDAEKGEIGQGAIFTPGQITVMVRANEPLGITDVHIQFDKLNMRTGKYEFYDKVPFTLNPKGNYFYFSKDDMQLKEVGVYRCFLLNGERVIANSSLEIIK